MDKPTIPSPDQLWLRYEGLILEVLDVALKMLQEEESLAEDEPRINLRLYLAIRDANRQLHQKGRGLPNIPLWEGRNQPSTGDEMGDAWLAKSPDFQWQIVNDLEADPDKVYRHYTIECKRLGNPPRKTWILNENYVRNGILRYVKKRVWLWEINLIGNHDWICSKYGIC